MHSLHLLLQRFADARLDFVVVGGYAGVLHGSSLVTNDLDICAMLSPENVAKLRTVLADRCTERPRKNYRFWSIRWRVRP